LQTAASSASGEIEPVPRFFKTHGCYAQDVEDREISLLIHQSILPAIQLELFPKSTIDVFLTVLENGGLEGCVAAGSIVASTALADAGVEMFGMVVSCSAVGLPPNTMITETYWVYSQAVIEQEIWLDPDSRESEAAQGTVVLSGLPALGTITNSWQAGSLSPPQVVDVRSLSPLGPHPPLIKLPVVYGRMPLALQSNSRRSSRSTLRVK
jgi:exosome complex component MTR3